MPSYGLLADLDVLKKAVPVKFVGGKYKKKSGWIDPTRPSNGITVPVIVKSAEKGGLYQTYVEVDNYRELNTDKPMTFHEYVFLVPDVEAKVVDTCHTIAKFDISKDDKGVEGFKELFGKELKDAQEWQENKGDKARWRRIKEWEDERTLDV